MTDIGSPIRALREQLGWSQSDLAAKLGKTQTAISYWENGSREPGLDDVRALAAAFGVQPGALIGDGETAPQLLTGAEHRALTLIADLWNLLSGQIIESGPSAFDDRRELAGHIHAIQHAIMAQAAARAYPNYFRLLGGWPPGASREMIPE